MNALYRTGTLLAVCLAAQPAGAVEPNDVYASRTILAPGVRVVSDVLTPGQVFHPDTLLGIRNSGGVITMVDDNGSVVGNGFGSGIGGAPTNSTSIAFTVTGVGDGGFTGNHSQSGPFEVIVDIFNASGFPLGSISQTSTLTPGSVNQFSFAGTPAWIGGRYNVNIDNAISSAVGGDVDFYTFTGLPAGMGFVAQTNHPTSNLNTFMYLFDPAGKVIDIDDSSGHGNFSLIEHTVPAGGEVTLAVTGFGDLVDGLPGGEHTQNGPYQLKLTLASLAADFNMSGAVTAEDLAVWEGAFGPSAAADADFDFDSDGADFLAWQRQLGNGPLASAVPEMATALMALVGWPLAAWSTRGAARVGRPGRRRCQR